MDKLILRLMLLSLMIVGLACLSSAVSGADAGAFKSPTLEGARVAPENGSWGSTFTFFVTYINDNGVLPAPGYPKLYLDGAEMVMQENDLADNDVTDGKVYRKSWASGKENVGTHSFYFYVETPFGENARDPATGTHEGPGVGKRSVSLSCEVDNPEPATGETLTFSGHLTTEENLGVSAKSLTLYKLLLDEDVSENTTTTDENRNFALSLSAPGSSIFCYQVRFSGDNYYEASESPRLYVNTLDKPMVLGVSALILLALVGGSMFLLSRGIARAHYLKPVLLGFVLGFFLLSLGASFVGILGAGVIAGYLFARETHEWTKHLRIGCMTGFLFLLVLGLLFAYLFTGFPDLLGLKYSVTQTEVFVILLRNSARSLVDCVLMVGIGAVVGGMLRKALKPHEAKPSTVAGNYQQRGRAA